MYLRIITRFFVTYQGVEHKQKKATLLTKVVDVSWELISFICDLIWHLFRNLRKKYDKHSISYKYVLGI